MKKTTAILVLVFLPAGAAGLNFPEDDDVVSGEVNSSPPMPGDNFSLNSEEAEDVNKSGSSNSSNTEDFDGVLDDSEEKGFFTKILEKIREAVPFL